MWRNAFLRLLLDTAAGEGAGGGGGNPPANPPANDPAKGPDLAKAIEGLLAKHGGQDGALRVLLAENHGYRDQLRELKGKLPAEGAVVLSADDARVLSAYKALGTPDELKTGLGERDQYKGQVDTHAREKLHAEIADLPDLKWKAPVLSRLATQDGLTLTLVDGKDKAGKDVKVAHVKGEGDKATPLAEYAEKHWKDFLPSLKAEPAQQQQRGTPGRTGTAPPRPPVQQGTDRAAPRRNAFG